MKKITLSALFVSFLGVFGNMSNLNAQAIPNGSFENWAEEEIEGFKFLKIDDWYFTSNVSIDKNTPHSGSSAVILTSTSQAMAYCGSVEQNDFLNGKKPLSFTKKPTALKGYYKYVSVGGSKFYINIALHSGNTKIADAGFTDGSNKFSWTEFTIPITYTDATKMPDAFNISLFSEFSITFHSGATLYVDDLEFIYEGTIQTVIIEEPPLDQTVAAGQSVTFSVKAKGTGTLKYQWQKSNDGTNWNNISGATSSSYTITSATVADAGKYRCVVTDDNGSINTSAATLTVSGGSASINTLNNTQISKIYPNPANDVINVVFSLPSNADVKISISNLAGVAIKELLNTSLTSGAQNLKFNISDLQTGLYFLNIYSDGKLVSTSKIAKQ